MTGDQSQGFTDKVVLITGGGTGIGRAMVEQFVGEGARVFIVGRREAPLREVAALHEGRVGWITADVSKPGDAKRIVDAALGRFDRLDILINNAATGSYLPLMETSDEALDSLLAVNLAGPLRLCRESLGPLGKTQGQIINIGSTLANVAMPGTLLYSAAKTAMYQATRVLATEVGRMGIRVNAVAPGPTETEGAMDESPKEALDSLRAQAPFGRLGQADEVAWVVLLLARDEASWVTGQVLDASGGLML